MPQRVLRSAIIGTGGIAGAHAGAVGEQPDDVRLVAVTDVVEGRAAAFQQGWDIPRRYSSVEAMLAAEPLDLVQICTPPGSHAGLAIRCLEAGVNVLCEKPPCLTLAEFDRITMAERSGGAYFAGVFQHRFGATAAAVKRAVDDRTLGRPLVAVCHTLWYRDDSYYEVDWRGRWETEGGGPTMGHGIHQIDLLGHLLGDWRSVSAIAPRLARAVETEDVSLAHLTFDSGAVASVVSSVLSPAERTYLRIDFTEGTIELEPGGDASTRRLTTVDANRETWAWPSGAGAGSHALQLAETVEALRAGRRPPASGPGLRRTVELITGIYAAARSGGRLDRDDLSPDHPLYHRTAGRAVIAGGGR